MKIIPVCLEEPALEFGDGGCHIDPRFGLCEFGPLQPSVGDVVKIGVIGSAETVEGFATFMQRAMKGIDSERPELANLNPAFPGLGNRNPFRCTFEVDQASSIAIPKKDFRDIEKIARHEDAVRAGVELFINHARSLLEGSARPDVIVLALPLPFIQKVVNAKIGVSETGGDDEDEPEQNDSILNFRDLFKAEAINLRVPTQIAWPTLWDDTAKIPRKLKDTDRSVQGPATRAWNVLNALFYKAGKVPWRLLPSDGQYKTCYLGISFYRDIDGQQLWTSTAQMFDERGRGLILRGARAQTKFGGRHPYLNRVDAFALVAKSLDAYRLHHKHLPARIVVLKTSRFENEESSGFIDALDEAGVEISDLVWIQESSHISLLRDGNYPVLRGTFLDLGDKGLLYTRGSVPYYGTYPGSRVPKALMLRPHPESHSSLSQLSNEVLALTKMNWNSTQFDQRLPIPIRAAKEVGRILKYMNYGEREQSDYRYY